MLMQQAALKNISIHEITINKPIHNIKHKKGRKLFDNKYSNFRVVENDFKCYLNSNFISLMFYISLRKSDVHSIIRGIYLYL